MSAPLEDINEARADEEMIEMRTIQEVTPAKAYFDGMLWAAFGVRIFRDNLAEWQIDAVKKYAKKLKGEEIEHSSLSTEEKAHQKRLRERWIEETSRGFKEVMRMEEIRIIC